MRELANTDSPTRIWFSTAEAAAAIGKTAETLNRWVNEHRIPERMLRPLPRGFLWHRDWLDEPVVFTFAGKEEPQTWQEPGVIRTGNREAAQGGNRI